MKTMITSVKGPPLRRVLCSYLFGAAAFCVVATNIQAAIQAPPDIVWVTTGNTIAKYNADGTAINTNFITLQPVRLPVAKFPAYLIPYLGGILVSANGGGIGGTTDPILYVADEWVPNLSLSQFILTNTCWSYYIKYVIATYDAVTGRSIGTTAHIFGTSVPCWLHPPQPFGPAGMALSGTNFYVANYSKGSITKVGNLFFITGLAHPYALAVNRSVLYVTNNAQNSNGKFYISAYDANGGGLLNANLIEIATGGLYGLALQGNTLYVSVYSGSGHGVWTYNVSNPTEAHPIKSPLVSVNEPWGIAIGSPPPNGQHPTLYVASHQDSVIHEFDATTGVPLNDSIKVNTPTNITVYPATQ